MDATTLCAVNEEEERDDVFVKKRDAESVVIVSRSNSKLSSNEKCESISDVEREGLKCNPSSLLSEEKTRRSSSRCFSMTFIMLSTHPTVADKLDLRSARIEGNLLRTFCNQLREIGTIGMNKEQKSKILGASKIW